MVEVAGDVTAGSPAKQWSWQPSWIWEIEVPEGWGAAFEVPEGLATASPVGGDGDGSSGDDVDWPPCTVTFCCPAACTWLRPAHWEMHPATWTCQMDCAEEFDCPAAAVLG